MNNLRVVALDSIEGLRGATDAWNRLWEESGTSWPTTQAEHIVAWLEQFASGATFRAVAVAEGDRLLAALPLVGRRLKGLLEVAQLPNNRWTTCGDLLLATNCDRKKVVQMLVGSLQGLPWQILWMDDIPVRALRWKVFNYALARAKLAHTHEELYRVGEIDLTQDWSVYQASRSRNLRKEMRRKWRLLESQGPTTFEMLDEFQSAQVETTMRDGYEVEERSWKGESGQTVLGTPGMWEFHLREARDLARRGHLCVGFLRHQDRPIAFEYALTGKGLYFSWRTAYDPLFSRYSPGQLLTWKLLERLHRQKQHRRFSLTGTLLETGVRWPTSTSVMGRIGASTGKVGSGSILRLLRSLSWLIGRFRDPGNMRTSGVRGIGRGGQDKPDDSQG